ncbi:MAG: class I SAM-dependent methyltransferase [Acidimicrobiales bacterium]|nr:class I SAM-dependent methyltransferase [Actinomycetota bacterium]
MSVTTEGATRWREVARHTRGFMPEPEGEALHRVGRRAALVGPLLEVGTYCGKSAVYLGVAARKAGTVLFTVDHHRGSEENQPGWEHHDPAVVDPETGRIDTLPHLRRTLEAAGLEDCVFAVVGESTVVAAHWRTPLGLVFLDGGHGRSAAHADYDAWAPQVAPGGLLAIHDVFPDPADGGRPPYEVFHRAVESGLFVEDRNSATGSLRVLERVRPEPSAR